MGTKYQIIGETDDGEEIYETFVLPDSVPSRPAMIFLYAVRCLWEARWVPGSISWRVVASDGIPLAIGENYE